MKTFRYFIRVKGFDGREVLAESAGKARYAEFKAWREAGFGRSGSGWGTASFGEFVADYIEAFHHLGPAP